MKKFCKVFLGLLAILLLNFAFPLQGWAGGHGGTHTSKASVMCSPEGAGRVYISTSSTQGNLQEVSWNCDGSNDNTHVGKTVYLFASSVDENAYQFQKWEGNNETKRDFNTSVTAPWATGGTVYTAHFVKKFYFAVIADVDKTNSTGDGNVSVSFVEEPTPTLQDGRIIGSAWGTSSADSETKTEVTFRATPAANMNFKGWFNEIGEKVSGDLSYTTELTSDKNATDNLPTLCSLHARFSDPSKKSTPVISLESGETDITLYVDDDEKVVFSNVDETLLIASELFSPTINSTSYVDADESKPVVRFDYSDPKSPKIIGNRAGDATITFHHSGTDEYNEGNFIFKIHVEKITPIVSWKTSTLFIQEYGLADLIETPSDGAWSLESNNESVFASLSSDGTIKTTPSIGSVTLTFSQSASYKYNAIPTLSRDFNIYDASVLAMFSVNKASYNTLAEAITASTAGGKKYNIIVTKSGMVVPGDYTIPSGVTLLVPNSTSTTVPTTPSEVSTWETLTEYCRLSLLDGVNLIVNGTLCVVASQYGSSNSTPGPGSVSGAYGCIDMAQGGHITIANGAKLNAFGFIFGSGDQSTSGTITIQNGGQVSEYIVIQDMHGGGGSAATVNGTSASNKYDLFPFNQYYIQNIEPKMTIEYGGTEYVYYDVVASGMGKHDKCGLIGSTTSVLFQLSSGAKITKWYDATVDRQCYELLGTVGINEMSIYVSSSIGLISTKYVLPITNNMDITILSNATANVPNKMKMLPGSKLIVSEGGTINVTNELFIYDSNDWGNYAMGSLIKPMNDGGSKINAPNVTYYRNRKDHSAGKENITKTDLTNAVLEINGTLNIFSKSALYTTSTGSSIVSTGSGKIVYNVAAMTSNKNLYEIYGTYGKSTTGGALTQDEAYKGNNVAPDQVKVGSYSLLKNWACYGTPVACIPAQLRNADDSFTPTAGALAGATFTYINGMWVRPEGTCTEVYIGANGDNYITYQGNWVKVTRDGSTCDYYIDESGNKYKYNDPEWVKVFDLKWDANGGTFETSEETIVEPLEEGATITAPANPTREGYTFADWDPEVPATMPAEDMTITATWTINQYDITWKNADGTTLTTTKVNYNETPSYNGATPTKTATAEYTYTFDDWTPKIAAVTGAATYTATYTQTKNKYAITFKNEDGTELQKSDVEYGATPSYTGENPTKAATAEYTYTFNDWDKEIVPVTGTATYTATYTATKNKYAITFQNENGTELQKTEVEYGAMPSYTGATPTKAADAQYTYTFKGWDKNIVAVTGTATYTATFTATAVPTTAKYTVKHYKLHIKNGQKFAEPFKTDESEEVEIGTKVTPEFEEIKGYDYPAKDTTITISANPNENVVIYEYPISETNTLEVENDTKTINDSTEAYTVILAPGKTMNITETGSVTAKNLVLQSKPGDNLGANLLTTTNLEILGDVCIEIEMNRTGTMNDKLYDCFSVPFNVNVDDGVKRLNETNDNWESAELNTNYRVYTYNEADRAINGRQDSNWKEFSGTQFAPGVFYLCEFDNSNYNRYRFYAADKTNLNNKGNIAVTHTGDATNGGWNGVANNSLTDNQLSGSFEFVQTLNSVSNSFESAKADEKPLAIGNAAMVQVSASGSVVVGETSSAVAARRMGEAASTEFINVRLYKENQNQHVDQIFIRASEDAAEQYVAGIDLSKATMGTPKVARLWVNDYDLQLVANEARMNNNQAIFSLGMSAPANGEYTIALDETPADAIVYLTMNGSAIWNLNIAPAPISLSKGTENSYGLRLVRKINNVVTGFDEAVLNGNVQKVILNDHLYIIRDGKVYSAHGHVIK